MRMTDISALLAHIENFAEQSGMSPAAVCRSATNNPRLYDRLKTRGKQTENDAKRILKFIANSKQQPVTPE